MTGDSYFVSFLGLAGGNTVANLAFTAAVIVGWAWITLLMVRAGKDGGLR